MDKSMFGSIRPQTFYNNVTQDTAQDPLHVDDPCVVLYERKKSQKVQFMMSEISRSTEDMKRWRDRENIRLRVASSKQQFSGISCPNGIHLLLMKYEGIADDSQLFMWHDLVPIVKVTAGRTKGRNLLECFTSK